MTTYNTGNPVPSADARDRYDNSQTFDEVVNGGLTYYTNRVGNNVLSLKGMADMFNAAQVSRADEYAADKLERDTEFADDQADRAAEFQEFLDGTGWVSLGAYGAGISIVSHTQTVDYLGQPYSLKPSVPASLETPYVTTGVWATEGVNFKLVGDNSLRQDLAASGDASKGAGQVGNSIIVVETVAEMVALTNLTVGKRVRTRGYRSTGDGGANEYAIVAAGTGVVDGGRYIDVTGAQARGLFPNGIVAAKQYGALGDSVATGQDILIRAALGLLLTDSAADASGAEVRLNLAAYLVSAAIPVLGDKILSGTGGPNATKLIASAGIPSGSSILTLPGAFSIIERMGLRVPASIYNPTTGIGTPIKGIHVDNANAFGNTIRNVRINGSEIAIHVAAGFETSIKDSFIIGAGIGIQSDAWDTYVSNTIIQDCFTYGVNAVGHGLEGHGIHIVRCAILLNLISNGAPVNLINTFLDTPLTVGARFNDQRRSRLTNTYILKIGNNLNANAVGMKFENNSSDNMLIGGSNVNAGENFLSVFQFDATCINNVFAFWHTNTKTVNDRAAMRRQTMVCATGHAAQFNNIVRQNRGQVSGVLAGATAQIILTLDFDFPALTFNTLLFFGKWVSRNTSSQSAYGDMFLPIQFSDSGSALTVNKISGHANNNWAVNSVTLAGTQMIITVQNNGTLTASISVAIERSLDATGATF